MTQPSAPVVGEPDPRRKWLARLGQPSEFKQAELIVIGKLSKPHGLRGEISCLILTDFPERFEDTELVQLIPPAGDLGAGIREVPLESSRLHHGRVLLKLAGVDSIDQAQYLRNYTVAITEEELVQLEEGEYYHFQLEGLDVVDEGGARVGRLTSVLATPAHEIYVVDQNGRELLIPAVEEYVRRIDLSARTVTVRVPVTDED